MEKINIAVCDDDNLLCQELSDMLKILLNKQNITHTIDIFYDAESLISEFVNDKLKYDLVFLDIELPSKTGIETGTFIRNHLKNQSVEIAYISSNTSYAMKLFDTRPINFLEKPITNDSIQKVINSFLELKCVTQDKYHFKIGKNNVSVSLSDILYFEQNARKVIIHTIDNTFEHYAKLEDIYNTINNKVFIFIHKSYIVNYNYISKFKRNTVEIINQIELPISKSKKAESLEKISLLLKSEI